MVSTIVVVFSKGVFTLSGNRIPKHGEMLPPPPHWGGIREKDYNVRTLDQFLKVLRLYLQDLRGVQPRYQDFSLFIFYLF